MGVYKVLWGSLIINIAESYRVSFNHKLYIIRVGDKLLLTIRPKGIIETVVLRVLLATNRGHKLFFLTSYNLAAY